VRHDGWRSADTAQHVIRFDEHPIKLVYLPLRRTAAENPIGVSVSSTDDTDASVVNEGRGRLYRIGIGSNLPTVGLPDIGRSTLQRFRRRCFRPVRVTEPEHVGRHTPVDTGARRPVFPISNPIPAQSGSCEPLELGESCEARRQTPASITAIARSSP
jgi:hypothetical protein